MYYLQVSYSVTIQREKYIHIPAINVLVLRIFSVSSWAVFLELEAKCTVFFFCCCCCCCYFFMHAIAPHTDISFTVCSSITRDTEADVAIISIHTGATIHAWVWVAFICNKSINYQKSFRCWKNVPVHNNKLFCITIFPGFLWRSFSCELPTTAAYSNAGTDSPRWLDCWPSDVDIPVI